MQADAYATGWQPRALSLAAGAALWEVAARLAPTSFLPPFSAVIAALVTMIQQGAILANLAVSLGNLALGFAGAVAVGLAAGIAMSRFRRLAMVGEPYLTAFLTAPSLVYVPVLFTIFGATRLTQIGSVFLHAVFVIATTTLAGLRERRPGLEAMAASFGATDRQIFWKVRWPSAQPPVMNGLRVGVLLAVKGMINGEMFIAFTGLGALVRIYGGRFEADKVLAIILVVVVVALLCALAVDALERRRPSIGWRA